MELFKVGEFEVVQFAEVRILVEEDYAMGVAHVYHAYLEFTVLIVDRFV